MSADNNDDPKHNRKHIPTHSPSPTGTIKISARREVTITVDHEEAPEREIVVDLSRNDIHTEEKVSGTNVLLRFSDDGPCPEGVDGGRITRMTITQGEIGKETILAHFENGKWYEKAQSPLAIQVQMRMQKEHNGLDIPDIKATFDHHAKQKLKP